MQQITTNGCPCQTSYNTNLVVLFSQTIAVFFDTQEIVHVLSRNNDAGFFLFDDLGQRLTCRFANLTLKVTNASFTCVIADDVGQSVISQLILTFFQAVVLDLLWQQVLLGDLVLFVLSVT